ncbi:hypothetical protein [Chitinolyticbacter meiyuanensis]|uniref:hypothetical protein n=1 Tax=Chitinolyticbacter meiyuanensis TaxID=682798 RepID=UPI0011E5CD99|nr:hypothetical protein [Chitinolyticbacter meiyuanensis]
MDSKASKRKTNTTPLPSVSAFTGRETVGNTVYTAPKTDFTGAKDGLSSYPHLTHKSDTREAHLTDVRLLTTVKVGENDFNIHERFHLDDKHGSSPKHDRFLATDNSGKVFGATMKLEPTGSRPLPKKLEAPRRDSPLFDPKHLEFAKFNVLSEDDKHPPLSPRTQRRTLEQK